MVSNHANSETLSKGVFASPAECARFARPDYHTRVHKNGGNLACRSPKFWPSMESETWAKPATGRRIRFLP
jgi:hypothetical protein